MTTSLFTPSFDGNIEQRIKKKIQPHPLKQVNPQRAQSLSLPLIDAQSIRNIQSIWTTFLSTVFLSTVFLSTVSLSTVFLSTVFCTHSYAQSEERVISVHTLKPSYTSDGVLGVESALLPKGDWGLNLSTGWAQNPIQPSFNGVTLEPLISQRVDGHLQAWTHFSKTILVGVHLPLLIYQTRGARHRLYGVMERLDRYGIGDISLSVKAPIFTETLDPLLLALQLDLSMPTASTNDYFKANSVNTQAHLLLGYQKNSLHLLSQFTYHYQDPFTYFREEVGDHLVFRLGTRYLLGAQRAWGLEAQSTYQRPIQPNQSQSELKVMGGFSKYFKTLQLQTYVSRGLIFGLDTAEWEAGMFIKFEHAAPVVPLPPPPPPERPIITVGVRDHDHDLVVGEADLCPTLPGSPLTSGCPMNDLDGDLINNDDDLCEWTFGESSNQGCPLHIFPIPKSLRKSILFKLDKHKVTPRMKGKLRDLISLLREKPDVHVHLSGHSDSIGSDSYNLALSYKRVRAIKSYLIQNNVSRDQVHLSAYGDRFIDTWDEDDEISKSTRRVVITFIVPPLDKRALEESRRLNKKNKKTSTQDRQEVTKSQHSSTGSYTLQVKDFRTQRQAESYLRSLKISKKWDPRIIQVKSKKMRGKKGLIYRLQVGRFKTRAQAASQQRKFTAKFGSKNKPFITRRAEE